MPSSPIIKRSVVIGGVNTSVSLEEPFLRFIRKLARQQGITFSALVNKVKHTMRTDQVNLSAVLRIYALEAAMGSEAYQAMLAEPIPDDRKLQRR